MKIHSLILAIVSLSFLAACCPVQEDYGYYCYEQAAPSGISNDMIEQAFNRSRDGLSEEEPKLTTVVIKDLDEHFPGVIKRTGEMEYVVSFEAKNFTPGKEVSLYIRNVLHQVNHFRNGLVTELGVFISDDRNELVPINEFRHYLRNFSPTEWSDFILVSEDQSEIAVVRHTPRPVRVEGNAGRSVEVELSYGPGILFFLNLDGFQPNEELKLISQSGYEVIKGELFCNEQGKVVSGAAPAVKGKDGGIEILTIDGDHLEEPFKISIGWGTQFRSDAKVSPVNK